MKSPSEPCLLAIDTANERCSVAVGFSGSVLAEAVVEDGFRHAEKLTLLIAEVLATTGLKLKNLDGVVVSAGPGSYTGLRIGASVAKGLCYGSGLPLIGIDTLEMMARGFMKVYPETPPNQLLVPMIDARRDEVFTAVLSTDFSFLQESAPLVLTSSLFDAYRDLNLHFFGSGAPKYAALFEGRGGGFEAEGNEHAQYLLEAARDKYLAGKFENVAYFKPDYRKSFHTNFKISNS